MDLQDLLFDAQEAMADYGTDTSLDVPAMSLENILRAALAAEQRVTELEGEVERLRGALETIGQWDMLNPPQTDQVSDLAWLRALVDAALSPAPDKEGVKG